MTAASAPAAALPTTEAGGDARFSNTFLRLKKKLERGVGEAIGDYNMIGDGDTVMVCVSGGKDSYTLLSCLLALRERAPVDFRIVAMNLDQKQPGFPDHVLPAYFESIGVEYRIVTEDTYSIVKDKIPEGKTTCSLCSRLRRGIIYRTATEIGATRIALGHHRDDMLETLFLNMFFGGKIKAMPPKLVSDDGKHVVIRPLAYCTEADIARFARTMDFPIIPCNLCGSQENAQRKLIKNMLQGWARDYPGRIESLATSLKNVVPSHLSDARLFDFVGLTQHTVVEEGDTAFDPPELPDRTLGASVKLFRAGDQEERECA
ncbi:MAG TPA: tRNA 2-thiocytidine(32) synthetase TtcA [Thauera aminoaromatica]|uniref:tRNA-cytidine(32) 2-sulfurtransferase n=2 Tax=Thauera aminoaromatica TaxID=164330 RepID=C4ZN55_THASP|nr:MULTISPECIES: tRNA 2-thiocytidine(32) synthetase TtcA [Thauera]MDA0234016.1 tRNA 2-thiocytidine(32) synthetase TtcA [Pseudomonadota bacterium]OPZ04525.1 MAG: tRNA 2-thiocytidine biosynthesis protein TtcA [Alphaproteobacteria bacterium ADurb.BinA305]ACK53467.1 PP-loop domain protein [Thauera aminoaromatica]ENO75695.1 tRNA 2-thiocytidine biosynthesis protein TtcA [Thauera aminoaromatica S2]KIN89914.1 tRNA 2-thiocytidine biosynthesis protein TtcA [Thauera sp. SWB20]